MINIRFTFNAPHRYKGKFTLCLYDSISKKRSYTFADSIFPIPCPNAIWNEKEQKFEGSSFQVNLCNKIVKTSTDLITELSSKYTSASEVLKAYKLKTYKATPWEKDGDEIDPTKGIPTLGEWVEYLAEELKKENSTNYQLYQTLANKLRGKDEKHKRWYTKKPQTKKGELLQIIPLDRIKSSHFDDFGGWINEELGGKGFKNLMTTLKAAYNKARQRYNLATEIKVSVSNPEKSNLIEVATQLYDTFSEEQIHILESAKLDDINIPYFGGISFELTRDILMLEYCCLTRPADALTFKTTTENTKHVQTHTIKLPEGQLMYVPYKKRNYKNRSSSVVSIKLQEKALNIVKKYEGLNEYGYVFPLEFLTVNWGDVTKLDSKAFDVFEREKKKAIEAINKNFKIICKHLNLPTEKATMYTMRHSAITKQVLDGINTAIIAKSAGTSISMIEKHYLKKDLSASLSIF